MVSLEFFIDITLLAALSPWDLLSLKQKLIPGIIHGGKGDQCTGLKTLPSSYTDCLETWEPQTSGTLRACQGCRIALPFYFFNITKSANLSPFAVSQLCCRTCLDETLRYQQGKWRVIFSILCFA
jgi:hypothetical protein